MKEPRNYRSLTHNAICNLNITLPSYSKVRAICLIHSCNSNKLWMDIITALNQDTLAICKIDLAVIWNLSNLELTSPLTCAKISIFSYPMYLRMFSIN